ncbi:MAG: succinate dehydrogenase, cytochrome b556 subunit [Candidatus Xenolissoclinum pacificiensis L6]|uniref:Succinate dehydrogenase cytochrome b556 subunit n=1 Tax=Candidatus Xenolissoclinum pacificiensis L6 TaxID=1401685 RepID=W2V283_9RICK|nr:MAG: succinate dehydrogenase, cytochrome b556 subunit [Candidatus Xenolissoclinum pacificiensis L6]
MERDMKPTSPFWIYKLPISAFLSISHRITGFFVFLTTLLISISYTLSFMMYGYNAYVKGFFLIGGIFGKIWLFLWFVSVTYHAVNGIRHFVWDMHVCFSKKMICISNFFVILVTVLIVSLVMFLYYRV